MQQETSSSPKLKRKYTRKSEKEPSPKKSKKESNPKKSKNPKKSATKTINITSLVQKLNHAKGVYFGIDPGVCSPALFQIQPELKSLKVYYFKKKPSNPSISFDEDIKDSRSCFFGWKMEGFCLEEDHSQDGSFERTNRMIGKIKPLLHIINQNQGPQNIAIENYAYQASSFSRFSKKSQTSASTTILAENGGILRMLLSQHNHNIIEVSIPTNKKQFTGNGHAKKEDMENAWLNTYFLLDLKPLLKKKKKVYAKLPSPLDDVYDSGALAIAALYNSN